MIVDIYTHYISSDSLVTATVIGKRYGFKLEREQQGHDRATREGQWVLSPLNAEFYGLNARVSITNQQKTHMHTLSAGNNEQQERISGYRFDRLLGLEHR